jgi:signal transduction histidine kinase
MVLSKQRNDIVARKIAVIFGILSTIVAAILLILFGVNVNTPVILALALFFFSINFIIGKGYSLTARVLLCTVPAAVTLTATLLAKVYASAFTDIQYYDTRFILILLSVLPSLIFDREETFPLYGSLAFVFILLVGFDPAHEALNVGYFQKGFGSASYYYINYITVITFFGLAAAAFTLKRSVQLSEHRYFLTYQRLEQAFKNVEAQNARILSQQAELINANSLIEKQKLALQQQVKEVNLNLDDANEELIKHNNELRQFSYTISHNLRGPIARLLGLAELAKTSAIQLDDESLAIVDHIQRSAKDLDGIIKDLNQVVDIRHQTFQTREEIDFKSEWRKTKDLLNLTDEYVQKHFEINFDAVPSVVSVRSMVSSILYNLVSNAIKYQAEERCLKVVVKTSLKDEFTMLEISDNGLGIDLALFGGDVFKLYKRFHTHQEGKGIGLYLVKSQVESLNGYIEFDSIPGKGSSFRIFLPLSARTTLQAS